MLLRNARTEMEREMRAPVNYVQNQDVFEDRRSKLNGILSFSGISTEQMGSLKE